MNALLEKTVEAPIQSRVGARFHLLMAYIFSILVLVMLLACRLASIDIPDLRQLAFGIIFIFAVVFTLAVYWHEKGKPDLRDAVMTIPWSVLVTVIIPPLVLAAARLNRPLQDEHLAHFDQLLSVSVPQIVSYTSQHWLGRVINRTYPLLIPLMMISALLPALVGKVKNAQQFLFANLIAFFIGLPLFALLPAIGPWYGYHFVATAHQIECQEAILLFRAPGHTLSNINAIICFPSFHVIWAIFCAAALWGFRLVRIPVALLSGMIIVSTVTTGWHYMVDVLGGIVVACLSLAIAHVCMYTSNPGCDQCGAGSGQ